MPATIQLQSGRARATLTGPAGQVVVPAPKRVVAIGATQGPAGRSSFLYLAYASDDAGAGFSLSPGEGLVYLAALLSPVEIETPTVEDFEGLWQQYRATEAGNDGDSAYEVAVANGFEGDEAAWLASLVGDDGAPGTPGTPGEDGDSAYEVAVANGFVGDEAAWLASLVGAGGAHAASHATGGGDPVTPADIGAAEILTYTAAVFVAKVGNDANTGTRQDQPKLTIASAITQAEALITGGATGVRVHVLDGADYIEGITVPTAVSIDAKGATLIGAASITGGSELYLDRHFAAGNNSNMLTLEGAGTGPAIYVANISDGRGTGGTFTGAQNIRNIGGGGRNLFAHVGILYTAEGGTGVGDVSSGVAGHIHIELSDLCLAGNNAIGILGSASGAGNSNIVGWIDHLLKIGTPTGTVGISMIAAGAVVKLTASEIVADTAYNIAAGSLYLACPKITGVRTGTPINRMIGTEDIDTLAELNALVSDATLIDTGDSRLSDERVPTAAGLTTKFGTAKVTIADEDKVAIFDSAATDAPKHSLFSLVKSTLKTYFDGLYNLYTHPNHSGAITSTGDGTTALGSFTVAALNTAISDATVATGGGTATGTNTGDNAVNSNYSGLVTNANHSGDATGDTVLTLATVNAGIGEFGSVTQAPILTVNAKGLVTAASEATITPAVGSITGLGTGVATALAINVGSAGAPVVLDGAAGTPSSLTLTNATGLPTAGILDDAVTLAKMAAGTAGNLITYDASGNPAAVATGTATHVLTSNGAGAAPTFQAAVGGAVEGTAILSTGEVGGTKFLREDGDGTSSWQTITGGGDALTSSNLNQFTDVTQTATKTLAITESTTLAGGTHSGTNTGDQNLTGYVQTTQIDTLTELNAIITDATLIDTTDARLSDARTPTAHTHGNISNTGAVGITAGLPLKTGTSGVVEVGAFGTTAGTFAEGDDSRLSDARTPTSHVHGGISNAGAIGVTSGLPIKTGASGVLEAGAFGGSAGQFAEGNHTHSATGTLGITIDGAGNAITTGVKGYLLIPYACTITSVEMVANTSGAIVIDLWKDTYANFPPTHADSITASAPPTITASGVKSADATLTGWTTSLAAGDYLAFNVDSAATVTRVTLALKVTRTI